jgi:NAD(P)-dependent dehydrogenase (short-subunit alcohol dehydrogenase family)
MIQPPKQPGAREGICLIVGGGSGIGLAIARKCLEAGWKVVVGDLDVSRWDHAATKPHQTISFNVLDQDSRIELIRQILLLNIPISSLAFTIGRAITKPLQSMRADEYAALMDLNTVSFLNLVQDLNDSEVFHPQGASIAVISSLVGDQGARGKIAYSASKGALNAAVRSLAMELAPSRIRINAISPGTVRTEMLDKLISTIGEDEVSKLEQAFPLGLGFPEDVADLAVFLLSCHSRWMTGTIVTIDGGFGAR